MDLEATQCQSFCSKDTKRTSYRAVLTLAYQSFGVVYGDLSTSPLYVYKSTFSGKLRLHENDDEILGVLSFIFWTFTLIPLVKYVFIVLNADDNGEGGTFALYSSLCRHANLSLLPSQQELDEEVSTYKLKSITGGCECLATKAFFEKHQNMRIGLLLVVLLATCMVIADGVITPTISVLSAVSGIKVAVTDLNEHVVVLLACVILVCLFALQKYGTHKVAFMFAPIVVAWLFSISAIGIYNLIHWNPRVLRALSPYYMYNFFKKTGVEGWISLGGILLCVTGTEAMFADLGHFSQLSIKLAFTCVVYPCLILAYMGQAAFLSKNHDDLQRSFYKSIPDMVYWPVVVIATMAAIVGSQAVISATFSIINQSLALRCFPTVKVIHTSKNIYGRIYIPEINWMLMLLCLAVTIGFHDTNRIGHAYGLAVAIVMLLTTMLMSLLMVVVWRRSFVLAIMFLSFFMFIEGFYLSAVATRIPEGGWLVLLMTAIFLTLMYVWHYGSSKKYEFDQQNKVSMKRLLTLGPSLGLVRVPGIGLIYTELVTGVPPVFTHFVTNIPAIHRFLVFICIRSVPVPFVPAQERYLLGRIGPKEYRMFRCIVRFGYKDVQREADDFENELVSNMAEFIEREAREAEVDECRMEVLGSLSREDDGSLNMSKKRQVMELLQQKHGDEEDDDGWLSIDRYEEETEYAKNNEGDSMEEELRELVEAKEAGISYILGHPYVQAKKRSSFTKKVAIDMIYGFLSRNCNGAAPHHELDLTSLPHICMIEVGMVYYV